VVVVRPPTHHRTDQVASAKSVQGELRHFRVGAAIRIREHDLASTATKAALPSWKVSHQAA
jgi:hypothetical protein